MKIDSQVQYIGTGLHNVSLDSGMKVLMDFWYRRK